eukprot:CAMPEP_0202730018 /NCGR_PEP_ID=MMETSP1385-20130828/186426_1 /ASSEMBLY_ACC=CAM_ASM_000861 /TAXON_ID=933848 /ORGANISM="Elphidium margaritaceum" /LENGTH=975 /DNA_ID=CAMNT_0049396291 /DNA_START=28 /DNA_END=2952 /DNA_ORIENTATION=+
MATLRKIVSIVTRSFYRATSKQLCKPSSTLLHHHYKQYSTTTNGITPSSSSSSPGAAQSRSGPHSQSQSKSPPIISNHSKRFQWSATGKLICLFSVTTVSYLAYKRLFGTHSTAEDHSSSPSSSTNSNAFMQSAIKLFEHKVCEHNLSFRMALFFDTRKQYDRALYFYKLFLRKPSTKKGESAALNNLVVIYYRRNEFENALIALKLLGKAQIQERNLEFVRAHCHHSLKQFDDALKYYELFIRNPHSKATDMTAAYNNLALLCYELGRYDDAAKYFQLIGDDKIVDKNYAFRVAHSLQNIDEFERSLKYYNLYLAHSDDASQLNLRDTYHNLGVLFYDHGQDAEALQMLRKLSRAEIEHRNLEFKMAHLCAKMGDKSTAIEYLRACTLKPEVYKEYALICRGILAQLLYETQEYAQACVEFDELGEAQIVKQDLFFAAAYSYAQCEEYAKALRFYELLLQHKSGEKLSVEEQQYIWSRIAVLQYRLHDYTSALDTLNQHLQSQYIAQWNLEFMLAHCHQKLGAYHEAITFYQQFLANKHSEIGDIQKCYQNLALLYFDLRQFAKCIEYFALIDDEEISALHLDFYVARCYHELTSYNANFVELAVKYYKRYLKLPGLDAHGINMDVQHQANLVDAYTSLGAIYFDQQQWRNALDMFEHLNEDQILRFELADKMSACYAAIGDEASEQKYLNLAAQHTVQKKEKEISLAQFYYNIHQNQLAADMLLALGDDVIVEHDMEFMLAHCLQLVGDNAGAIKYYLLGLNNAHDGGSDGDAEQEQKQEEVVNAWHNIGCAYHDIADYEHAAEYFGKLSMAHIQRTNTEFIVAVCYHHLKRYQDALRYYQLYLDNALSEHDEQSVKSCYNNMIICYFYGLKDLQNAYEYLSRMSDDDIVERKFLYEMARCAQHKNDREQSMKYYQLFLKHNQEALNEEIIENVYQNVHSLCVDDKQFMPQIQKIKENGHGDKQKELQLFVAW